MQNNLVLSLIVNSILTDSISLLDYLLSNLIILNEEEINILLGFALINQKEKCTVYLDNYLNKLSLKLS